MFRINLPILQQEIVDDKLVETENLMSVNIDTSIAAEIRWEEAFPKIAETTTLFSYIERFCNITDTSTALSAIKGLYPFIEFTQPTSFLDFCKMFNFSNAEFFKKFVDSIKNAFELIYPDIKKKD